MNQEQQAFRESEDALADLVDVMRRLRDPKEGCPWDLEQTFRTIIPYTLEEAYEVADAIERNNLEDLKEELGDLLLQVMFHSQMAKDAGVFDIEDVARGIVRKMVRRHPHVFSDADIRTADAQTAAWETEKARERDAKLAADKPASAMDGVAAALPSLVRAEKLQNRAARTGFEWTEIKDVIDKLNEEVGEVLAAETTQALEEEIGDVLFVAANLARVSGVDPEAALRAANAKFEQRFRKMEKLAEAMETSFSNLTLAEQQSLWRQIKKPSL